MSNLGVGFVEVVDKMGSDETVVNSARVSFGKRIEHIEKDDVKLLYYLAKNQHYSPFRHVIVQFHIKAPEFVARQFYKHIIGSDYAFKDHAWNEISGRYIKYDDVLWFPEYFRIKAKNVKQGSIDEKHEHSDYWLNIYKSKTVELFKIYTQMLEDGVSPEQARTLLPLNFYTEWYWTASLQCIYHLVELRYTEHAQKEIREYAERIDELMFEIFPYSWEALKSK